MTRLLHIPLLRGRTCTLTIPFVFDEADLQLILDYFELMKPALLCGEEPPSDAPVIRAKEGARKNRIAAELGSRGGQIGGHARAASLSPERRSEIAQKAARARWDNLGWSFDRNINISESSLYDPEGEYHGQFASEEDAKTYVMELGKP